MNNNKKSSTRELVTMIWGKKKIDAKQLLLLLQHDKTIQGEIRSIVVDNQSKEEIKPTKEELINDNYQLESPVAPLQHPSRTELTFQPEQKLLDLLLNDKELANSWIVEDAPRDRQIVQLIVAGSQWDNIQQLWKNLKKRCNEREDKATENELAFLQGCLDLHNLNREESKCSLDKPLEGDSYDYDKHQRASITATGEKIGSIWLYGLINANGKPDKQHKSIVATKQ